MSDDLISCEPVRSGSSRKKISNEANHLYIISQKHSGVTERDLLESVCIYAIFSIAHYAVVRSKTDKSLLSCLCNYPVSIPRGFDAVKRRHRMQLTIRERWKRGLEIFFTAVPITSNRIIMLDSVFQLSHQ